MSRSVGSSDYITLRQARAMWRAAQFADRIGRPLNYALSLHLEAFVEPREDDHNDGLVAYRLLHFFQCRARRWLERRGYRLVAIWAREAEGSPNEHVHLALHIPPRLVLGFAEMLPVWSGATHPQAFLLKPVGPPRGLTGWFQYMVISASVLPRLGR